MLDIKFVREHAGEVRQSIQRRKDDALLAVLDTLLAKDEEWRNLKGQADELRAQRNRLTEQVNAVKKQDGDINPILAQAKAIPGRIKETEERMLSVEREARALLSRIPNVMHDAVPYGKDARENPEVKRWGTPRQFPFPVKTHVELAEGLGVVDFDASATTSGNGFYFLKGDLGLLNQALLRFATDVLTSKGYTYVEPPLMVKLPVLEAAMDMNAIKQSIYEIAGEERATHPDNRLCLIGTAEHAILGMHAQATFAADDLPLKYAGYSMCFRQEIGSHGINEKGLWRTHQFNKVEQFVFCLPEQAWELYDELLRNSEEILQALQLPYRVIELCTGDLAIWKSRSHDLEVWRPTTESYGEVMSLSNCGTFQAQDLGIRYVRRNHERGVVHTLNNTAMATSRILVAILENYQEQDGSVRVPDVLQPYLGGVKKLRATRKIQKI